MAAYPPLAQNPNFHRLWTARVIARFGSSLGYVALLWITFAETGSALAVAYVGVASFVPTVAVGVFSGALVDRFERRRVVVLSNLGRGIAMGALVLALYLAGFHLVFVIVASLVFSACATFFAPGSQALLPEIVARESLENANGLFESTESIAGIAGSGVAGGLIITVGAVPSLGVDAASYLLGAMLVGLIVLTASSPPPATHPGRPGMWTEVRDGFRYLRGATGLFQMTLVALILNFLLSLLMGFVVVYSTDLLHGSALIYGLLEACLAAGWGIGGLVVGRLGLARFTGLLWIGSALAEGAFLVLMVLVPSPAVVLPIFLGFGISEGLANVAWLSTVQATVPERMQGRYFAIDNAFSYAAIPLSQIVGGVAILLYGVGLTFVVAGVGCLGVGAGALLLRDLRRVGFDARPRPS